MGAVATLLQGVGTALNGENLLRPRDIRRLLDAYGLAPRKAAGQNFVVDANIVRRIVNEANLTANDVVLEIGPGLGSLTLALAQRVRRVVAIEIDAGLAAAVRDVVAPFPHVDVVHADALDADIAELVGDRCRVVANLPYNVATPIVMHLLASDAVDDLFVMVQREVGERWAAQPGNPLRAAISAKLDVLATVTPAFAVPRTVFYPTPNVDSVMVRITRRAEAPRGAARDALFALIEQAFAQRRKTLRNNLRTIAPEDVLAASARQVGIDLGDRAERLPTSAFQALAKLLSGQG